VRTLLAAAVAALLAGAAVARLGTSPLRAEGEQPALYVSGLHIDGDKPTALIDLANRSESADDYYAISVLFFHTDGRRAAEQLDLQSPLTKGKTVTINVGGIVAAYRAANEIGPFKGPVQVVIYGYTCVDLDTCINPSTPRPFGPDVIHVTASQKEGPVSYDAAIEWRVAQPQ
jgi:hypothetical protein